MIITFGGINYKLKIYVVDDSVKNVEWLKKKWQQLTLFGSEWCVCSVTELSVNGVFMLLALSLYKGLMEENIFRENNRTLK